MSTEKRSGVLRFLCVPLALFWLFTSCVPAAYAADIVYDPDDIVYDPVDPVFEDKLPAPDPVFEDDPLDPGPVFDDTPVPPVEPSPVGPDVEQAPPAEAPDIDSLEDLLRDVLQGMLAEEVDTSSETVVQDPVEELPAGDVGADISHRDEVSAVSTVDVDTLAQLLAQMQAEDEPVEGEISDSQYQSYILGCLLFFVVVVLCFFVYKFFNMFF